MDRKPAKLVILDRDGVINEDSDAYITSAAEWTPIPGSLEAVTQLCQAGYQVYIASNQSGIGRGLFDYDALFGIHDRLQRALGELGGRISGIFFAPAHPNEPNRKRKPQPGMLEDLAQRLQIKLAGVPFVGDSLSDVEAGRAMGMRTIMVLTGKGERTIKEHALDGVEIYPDLSAFVQAYLAQEACGSNG